MGRIPLRAGRNRGYRRGWDPEDRWQGLVPIEGMPVLVDPPEGWIRSANNRTAAEDFPYPLSGAWSSGLRALRIRQMISEKPRLSRADFVRMQMDVLSLRAVAALPPLLATLAASGEPRVRRAAVLLNSWDCRMEPASVAATIFEVFFQRWSEAVAAERFHDEAVSLMAGAIGGLAMELLSGEGIGWFSQRNRKEAVLAAFSDTLNELEARLDPDMSEWTWGRIHTISLKHHLSEIGDLSELLDRGEQPVGGNGVTVCNTGSDTNYVAATGANYRLVAELDDGPPTLWSVDAAGQSGNPGSPHYCDQLPMWLTGSLRRLPLDRERVEASATSRLLLTPID